MIKTLRNIALSACSLAAVAAQANPRSPGWGHGDWEHGRDHGGRNLIRCESSNYRPNHCFTGGPIRFVRLRRQHSNSPCIEGRTWGYSHRGIWVTDGCRASFEVSYR